MNIDHGNILLDMDIESILQCPVCYEIPPKVIIMCKVGHHMCERCRSRLTNCPTCKSPLTGCRNFLGEALVNKLSILFRGSGGEDVNSNFDDAINSIFSNCVPSKHLSNNNNPLKSLPHSPGVFKCLLESCPYRNGMGVGHMYPHVSKVHTHIFDKFNASTATFIHKFENFCFRDRTGKFHRAFQVTNMGLFFLMLECVNITSKNYIHCWLQAPAQPKRCDSFKCELMFAKEDSSKSWIFQSKVASCLLEKNQVFDIGRIFVIPPEHHLLKNGDFFSVNVKIVYNPTEIPPSS